LGSGTTIVAAEDTGRICFGTEIDPHYVDVALRRYREFTGDDPIHSVLLRPFSQLEQEAGRA
jgi:DNA modification methylase